MQSFELSKFDGGLNESFAASDFSEGQWARLRGFVIESEKHVRSQWRIREVSASPTYTPSGYPGLPGSGVQQIWPLSGQFGDYIVALVLEGDLEELVDGLYYTVRYWKVGNQYNTGTGRVWPMVDSGRENLGYGYGPPNSADSATDSTWGQYTGDDRWKRQTVSSRGDWPYDSFAPVLTAVGGSAVKIPYRKLYKTVDSLGATAEIYEGDDTQNYDYPVQRPYLYGTDPRFIGDVPFFGGTSGTRKNGILLNCGHYPEYAATFTQISSATSYIIYEDSDGTLKAQSYTNTYPFATADTDADNDGVLDNGGATVVGSGVIPRANVGVWWRGQLILGDVEYFADPSAVFDAHSAAYTKYVAAYKDWLAARSEYKYANGQSASYPITAPVAIASLQLNRGTTYIAAYDAYITSWRTWFLTAKTTLSNTGAPTAPTVTAVGDVRRWKNGIWFSQPGSFDKFHPFAFTGDACPPDAQIVGLVPVEDGLIVVTTSSGGQGVVFLRGSSFGYIADDAAILNIRVETVSADTGSKPLFRTENPPRVSKWSEAGAAVWIGSDSAVYASNGSDVVKLDNFREREPQEDKFSETTITTFPSETTEVVNASLPGSVPSVPTAPGAPTVIGVENPGIGATFVLRVPLVPSAPASSLPILGYKTEVYRVGQATPRVTIYYKKPDPGGYIWYNYFEALNSSLSYGWNTVSYALNAKGWSVGVGTTTSSSTPNPPTYTGPTPVSSQNVPTGVRVFNSTYTTEASLLTPRPIPGDNVHSLELNGRLPVNDEVFCTSSHVFLSRNQRWYVMTRLPGGKNVWSELVFPVFYSYQPFAPKHMCEVGGNLYFIGELGTVWRMEMQESENQLWANLRGTFSYNAPTYPATWAQAIADYNAGNLPTGWVRTETPTLTVSTPTVTGADSFTKSFWHRIGVRVRRPFSNVENTSGFVSRILRIVTSDKPAVERDMESFWLDETPVQYVTTLNQDVKERTEVVVPAHGPSVEFSATADFEGDVIIEGITMWRHGSVPRRK